jgi:hypothetical protein
VFLTILILSSLIEFTHGHIFVLLLFVTQFAIQEDVIEKKLSENNDCCINLNKLSFLLGASFISLIMLISNTWAIIGVVLLIIGMFGYFNYIKQIHSTETEYLERVKKYQNYYTLGSIIPILITLWAKYEIEPQKQYIKIFLRR